MNDYSERRKYDTEKFCLDSNIIIAFFNCNLEKILEKVFSRKAYFSSEIIKELENYDLTSLGNNVLNITSEEASEFFYDISIQNPKLSMEDVHLIAVCKYYEATCVTFEKRIRKICDENNIKNIGLAWILKEAIGKKIIENKEAILIINKFKLNGVYLSEEIIKEIIKIFS